jgi:hypothetical protein
VLPIDRWIDQLGQRLAQGRASELDRQVGMDIARQAEVLVLRAYAAYRGGPGRVPEVVRRRARARAAEPVAAPAAAPAPVVLPLAA